MIPTGEREEMAKSGRSTAGSRKGIAYALSAYGIWGITPIYWKLVAWIPADEMLVYRVLWTALFLQGWICLTRRGADFRDLLRGGKQLWTSLAAAILLGFNWLVFIYAVQTERILAASLGYYINPLVSVLLGLIVLGERLSRLQGIAVASAAAGVLSLLMDAEGLPWISVALALSFALYGLLHKLYPQPPRSGLALEMGLLAPLAIGYSLWLAARGQIVQLDASFESHLLVAASALVTSLPLLCFHGATRHLTLVSVGMFQYIAPTIGLLLAVFIYGEPFERAESLAFGCVWLGLLCFAADAFWRSTPRREEALSPPDRNR